MFNSGYLSHLTQLSRIQATLSSDQKALLKVHSLQSEMSNHRTILLMKLSSHTHKQISWFSGLMSAFPPLGNWSNFNTGCNDQNHINQQTIRGSMRNDLVDFSNISSPKTAQVWHSGTKQATLHRCKDVNEEQGMNGG